MANKEELLALVDRNIDQQRFLNLHWEGTFDEYIKMVGENPALARNAFQRIYDMIMHFGYERYTFLKQDYVKYHFFSDPMGRGVDAIFGLDRTLMQLVDFFKSAASGYGTERRILLLHGPVGSSKSTLVRLLKKGLEYYSRLDEGALYSFAWKLEDEAGQPILVPCPMHEEPLKLIPLESREAVLERLNADLPEGRQIRIEGNLDPFCRKTYDDLLVRYNGDWRKVMDHIVVRRIVMSEKDRRGIGTFQPKDEKNQDSTELTGDINYRKIAEYGSDAG